MDAILDKLLDKVSKKQVICVIAIIALMQLQAQPYYVFGIAAIAISIQGVIDYFSKEKSNEKSNDVVNVPAGG